MDAVPIVPPFFQGTKTRHFTSYKQATDHALSTLVLGVLDNILQKLRTSRFRNSTSAGLNPPAEACPVTVPGLIVSIFTLGMFFPASVGSNSGLSRSFVPVRIRVFALIEASAFAVSPL